MDDVSVPLGHSSVQTTERYYARRDQARRERLRAVVAAAHSLDPVLTALGARFSLKCRACSSSPR